MGNTHDFSVHFWGGRGTLPVCGHSKLRYGGNTSCVEVRCGEVRLILDAGTGLKALGDTITSPDIDILLSHTHIDHISGFPFFMPLYKRDRHIRLWAGHLKPEHSPNIARISNGHFSSPCHLKIKIKYLFECSKHI